ncbi:ArgP/LysG family DNA-binding transcriptional regulator [Galbitalea sp. SE-J8]|uniref:ArgP/LysG family DNA-binding transcriptional regulator n=1 Tax=Galbitalea sp. SE-J8 TaxID=3054952 RepID=UPI00338DB625
MEIAQLRALVAVVDAGSFDAAARVLHVTPSAVSQRIKVLESSAGAVLVRRAKPATATDAGARYVRLGRQLDALLADATAPEQNVAVPLAVGSDVLATWLLPALLALPDGVQVDVRREDQGHSADLLRAGAVMGAITSDPEAVAGCTSEPLGVMRYRPRASAAFARRWFPDGATVAALTVAPVVVFDRKDELQDRYLAARSRAVLDPPRHHIPESTTFALAVRGGLGWAMLPDAQAEGTVVLDERRHVDVPLHWQQWALRTPALDAVADAVRAVAASALRR